MKPRRDPSQKTKCAWAGTVAIVLVILLAGVQIAHANNGELTRTCEMLFEPMPDQQSWGILGLGEMVPGYGMVRGTIWYRYFPLNRVLQIDDVQVYRTQDRRKGYGRALVDGVWHQHRQTQVVTMELTGDNSEVYYAALRSGASQEEAILQTPTASAFLRRGFARAEVESMSDAAIGPDGKTATRVHVRLTRAPVLR